MKLKHTWALKYGSSQWDKRFRELRSGVVEWWVSVWVTSVVKPEDSLPDHSVECSSEIDVVSNGSDALLREECCDL